MLRMNLGLLVVMLVVPLGTYSYSPLLLLPSLLVQLIMGTLLQMLLEMVLFVLLKLLGILLLVRMMMPELMM